MRVPGSQALGPLKVAYYNGDFDIRRRARKIAATIPAAVNSIVEGSGTCGAPKPVALMESSCSTESNWLSGVSDGLGYT